MLTAKKLTFAPFFLFSFAFLLFQLNTFLKSYDFIFSFSASSVVGLLILSGLISFSSLFFVLFASLAYDWRVVLPVAILASILPLFFINQSLGLILAVGILAAFLFTYLGLENTLKTYLDFKVGPLFTPHIKRLGTFLILVLSITYFLSISSVIQEKSFQIPESLIDQTLKLTLPKKSASKETQTQNISIPKEQVELLKQDPDLLAQYGLDPDILDAIGQPQQSSKAPEDLGQDTLKEAVKGQLDTILKPYLSIIPTVLAVLLFFILQSLVSLLNLLIYPLLWIIFYILGRTGFVKFTEEQRTVKKMAI